MAEGSQVTVVGSVTMLPGALKRRIYIEDETGGIGVYLRRGDFSPLMLGDLVRATGRLTDYYGETQIEVSSPSRVSVLGHDAPRAPRWARTGSIGESDEGCLVWIVGRITGFARDSLTLDDGSGPLKVYFPAGLSWRRPYVQIGETWGIQGIIGQYVAAPPYVGGYQLIPRAATDLGRPPLFLPTTGR